MAHLHGGVGRTGERRVPDGGVQAPEGAESEFGGDEVSGRTSLAARDKRGSLTHADWFADAPVKKMVILVALVNKGLGPY